MALRVGYGGLSFDDPAKPRLLDAARRIVDLRSAWFDEVRTEASVSFPHAVNNRLRTGADKGNPTV